MSGRDDEARARGDLYSEVQCIMGNGYMDHIDDN